MSAPERNDGPMGWSKSVAAGSIVATRQPSPESGRTLRSSSTSRYSNVGPRASQRRLKGRSPIPRPPVASPATQRCHGSSPGAHPKPWTWAAAPAQCPRQYAGRWWSGTGDALFPDVTVPNSGAMPHHIVHWANGGDTSLSNLTLLCRRHHRLIHEGGWTLQTGPDGLRFTKTDGSTVRARQPEP